MVSEMILQQTQVSRGLIKYPEFISCFPNIHSLSETTLTDVLKVWIGLGYNRRAKYLKQIAEIVIKNFQGIVPTDPVLLDTLPGIGPNTAAAIAVYSTNIPVVFIETNIRKIFIDEFFTDRTSIVDSQILPIIEATLDTSNPKEWYWALMDYGAFLSKTIANPNKKSRHYSKQSKYEGSLRQIRGLLLRSLTGKPIQSHTDLSKLAPDAVQFEKALSQLISEGFIKVEYDKITLV